MHWTSGGQKTKWQVWKAIYSRLTVFESQQNANAVKPAWIEKKESGTAMVVRPPHNLDFNFLEAVWDLINKRKQHPKKRPGCPSRNLKNYSWRLSKKITRKGTKRVQTIVKNKGGHTKYVHKNVQTFLS